MLLQTLLPLLAKEWPGFYERILEVILLFSTMVTLRGADQFPGLAMDLFPFVIWALLSRVTFT